MIYQRISPALYTLLIGYLVAISGFCLGYDAAIMHAVLKMPRFIQMVDTNDADDLMFLVVVLFAGAFIISIPAAYIADRFGRRWTIFGGCICFVVGSAIQTAADNRGTVLGGRAVAGIGIGMMTLIGTVYLSEIARPSMRGVLTTLQQFFVVKGVLIAAFIVYSVNKDDQGKEKQYKLPLGLVMGPAIILGALIMLCPESPRFLMLKGREQEAIQALARLHAKGDVHDLFVTTQAADIKSAIKAERAAGHKGFRSLFKNKINRRRLMVTQIVAASAQVTGQAIVQNYSPQLYVVLGFSEKRTLLFQSAHAALGLLGAMLCIALIDRVGRRPLAYGSMLVCAGAVAGCLASIAVWPVDSRKKNSDTGHYIFIGFTWLFYFAYNFGIGSIAWMYPVEVFNTTLRAKGSAVAAMITWISSLITTQGASTGFDKMNYKYYIPFAVLALINGLMLFLVMPESKGRTLEEMDLYWAELEDKSKYLVVTSRFHRPEMGRRIGRNERENELKRGAIKRLDSSDSAEEVEEGARGVELGAPSTQQQQA